MGSSKDPAGIIHDLSIFSAEDLQNNPNARTKALDLSKRLTSVLENPVDAATQLVFSPYVATAARIAVGMNLFAIINAHEGSITTAQIATASKAEELLITRILRLLAAIGFVEEIAEDQWAATPTTAVMASAPIAAGYRFVWDVLITSAVKSPKFIHESGNRCPHLPNDGFVQYAHQTKHNVFDLLNNMPSLLEDFNTFMGNTMGTNQYWVDWYPVEERLLQDMDPLTTLLVDIGGGKGHDLQAFHTKYPNRGRLILQDLPQGLNSIQERDLDPEIERMIHNFFTVQPVQGARAYFLHHILHDWADSYSLNILEQIRLAMKPGYSKLLIHDLILPDTGANAYQTIWDMTMMSFNSGMERSRSQWQRLLEKAGFEVVKFWVQNEDADGIVEAVVAK
ncbi:MAG: hypothetical protein Q9165_007999 [Trypethelium subeluteriae]